MKEDKKEYNFPAVVRHPYNVDVFEIFDNFKEKLSANVGLLPSDINGLKFMEDEELFFIRFMKNDMQVDLTENKNFRNFVIPSSNREYGKYLAWKILTMDPYKIEPMLSFQAIMFLGNEFASKDDFPGFVEFWVYDYVKGFNFLRDETRLQKIINWLERNRVFAYVNTFTNKTVVMSEENANVLFQQLKLYFPEEQSSSLRNLIFHDEKPMQFLIFNGTVIELASLYQRLKHNALIIVGDNKILTEWLINNFFIENKKDPSAPFPLNENTVYNYLGREDRAPQGKARVICDEFAPYLTKEKRNKNNNRPLE